MAQKDFIEFIKTNNREARIHLKQGRPEQAALTIDMMESFYAPIHYDRKKYPNAPFTEEAILNSYNNYNNDTYKDKPHRNLIRSARKEGDIYVFTWIAKPEKGIEGKKSVQQASRFQIPNEFLKFMGQKPKKGKDKIIGAHIESSAFLMLLRKAVDREVITEEQAQTYLDAFLEGDLESVITTQNPDVDYGPGTKGQSIKSVTDEGEMGFTYEEYKDISSRRNEARMKVETMTALPASANQDMADHFEKNAIKLMKGELEGLASEKWVDNPGSPSTINMYQEIIAAALLGKPVPKYKTRHKHKIGNPRKATRRVRNNKIKKGTKGKRASSQVEKAKFKNNLRTMKGQFASPTTLRALLNKKLPQTIIENMGYPSLENITGKFAQSVSVINITQAGQNSKIPTIQYTYEKEPYQIFEMGGKGKRPWATTERDPRVIIEASIREIAQEMMVNKFNTQRL